MATRLYLMPAVLGIRGRELEHYPKYVDLWGGDSVRSNRMDFGAEPWILCAVDLDLATDALVTANVDVIAINISTLDDPLSAAAVTVVQTKLEAANIPAGWVTTSLTMRQVVALVIRMFQLWQALNDQGITGTLFAGGVTLNSTFGSLPLATRSQLSNAASTLGLNTSRITSTTTLRTLMKEAADRLFPQPLPFLDLSF